jgi:hypothetical protein
MIPGPRKEAVKPLFRTYVADSKALRTGISFEFCADFEQQIRPAYGRSSHGEQTAAANVTNHRITIRREPVRDAWI